MLWHTLTVKELIPNALLILNDDILGGTHIQSIKATKKQCVWRMGKVTLPLMTPPLIKLKHNPRTIKKGTFMQNQMTFTTKMSTTSSQLQAHQIDAKHLSNPRYPRVSPLEACTPWYVFFSWPGHIFGLWISQKLPMVQWWNCTPVKRSTLK